MSDPSPITKDTLSIDSDIAYLLQMNFNGRVPGYEELAEAYLEAKAQSRDAQQLAVRQANALRRNSR